MVKIRDRIVQTRRGQANEQPLEMPESLARLKRLFRGLDGIIGAGIVNEMIGAPMAGLRIHMPGAPVPRGNE